MFENMFEKALKEFNFNLDPINHKSNNYKVQGIRRSAFSIRHHLASIQGLIFRIPPDLSGIWILTVFYHF